MKISYRNIPKYLNPAGTLPSKGKKTGVLKFDSAGNNIYFGGNWDDYHNWHSFNIVLPWLTNYNLELAKKTDWENVIRGGLDSWNDAGGFDWLNASPELRLHRMLSAETLTHQQYVIDNLNGLNTEIGKHTSDYIFPLNPRTGDRFENGTLIGRGQLKTDIDFGIQTGNRRPTIHIGVNPSEFNKWGKYFLDLGYVGAYLYLDHWVPTKDSSKATYKFASEELKENLLARKNPTNIPDVISPMEDNGNHLPVDPSSPHKFDWASIGKGFRKIFSDPNVWSLGRLGLNLAANEKIYGEQILGIKPDLRQTYYTHRQVVGDEATKLAYYRRAAQGLTKAARPFTSDADRLMAYQYEAKRVGDDLRALGDLADNLEIRRTSDESNQHQWANTQRATEVANANIASINLANALKHNLLALKHAANFSSIDNAIKEIQYRKLKLQEEEKTLNDQIFILLQQYELLSDPRIIQAQKDFQAILNKHKNTDGTYDWYNDEVRLALNSYNNVLLLIQTELLNKRKKYYQSGHNISFARKGNRITRRNYDNILYMSTRDVVEHFREMTKLSSDAQNRKKPKIEKLTSHPKGSTRRYLLGGVAPFLVYTPITLGGETTTSSSASTTSTKTEDKKGKEALDLVKDLFKELAGKGLQIDVNTLYKQFNNMFARAKAFGEELSTEDIQLMYLLALNLVNNIVRSKDIYDKAKTVVTNNGALNEIAVNSSGHYVVQDKDGLVKTTDKSLLEIAEEGLVPVTNQYLLYLREYSPLLFGLSGDKFIQNTITNGMGINQIGAQIKLLAGSLGHTESKIEGLTEVLSLKVKAGVLLLEKTNGTPDGIYEVTTKNLNSLAQINAALEYILSMLSPSLLAILKTHGDPKKLITNFLSSQTNIITELTMTGLTGKAATKNGTSSAEDKIKSNPILQMIIGLGGVPRTWEIITRDSKTKMSVDGRYYSGIPKIKEDTSIYNMLETSGFSEALDSKQGITLGDLNVDYNQLKEVMYSNTGGMIVTLPIKNVNGHKEVNLGVKETYEKAVEEVKSQGLLENSLEYYEALGKALKDKGLNSLLNLNGLPDRNKFGLFLVVEAYVTTKLKGLNTSSQYLEKVNNPSDELELRIIRALSDNKDKDNYSLDIDYYLWGNDVYRTSVFIPLNLDLNSAINAWGDLVKLEEADELEGMAQKYSKASNMRSSNSEILYETE